MQLRNELAATIELDQAYAQLGANATERFADIDFRGFNWRNNRAERGLITEMNGAMEDKLRAEVPAALVDSNLAENYAAIVLAAAEEELGRHEETSAVGHFQGVDAGEDTEALVASIAEAQSFDEFTLLAMANDEIPPSEMLQVVPHLSGSARADAESIIANRIMQAETGTNMALTNQWAQALEAAGHIDSEVVSAAADSLRESAHAAIVAAERAGLDDARAQLAARQAAAEDPLDAFGGPGAEEGIGDVVLTSAEDGIDNITTLELGLSGKTLDLSAALSVDPEMVTSHLNARQEGETGVAFRILPGENLTFNGGAVETGRQLGFDPRVHEMQYVSVTDERGRTGYVAADYLIN